MANPNSNTSEERTHIVSGVGQTGNDSQNPDQRAQRLLQNGTKLCNRLSIGAIVKVHDDAPHNRIEQSRNQPSNVNGDENLEHMLHEVIHIFPEEQMLVPQPKAEDDDAQCNGLFDLVDNDVIPLRFGLGCEPCEHILEQHVHHTRHNNASTKIPDRLSPLDKRIAQKHRVSQNFHVSNFAQNGLLHPLKDRYLCGMSSPSSSSLPPSVRPFDLAF